MKYETKELSGLALEFAVQKAVGAFDSEEDGMQGISLADYIEAGGGWRLDWETCGPIIEREHIAIEFYGSYWGAMPKDAKGCEVPNLNPNRHAEMSNGWCPVMATGTTPLVAAMRAFVSAKIGDKVEL